MWPFSKKYMMASIHKCDMPKPEDVRMVVFVSVAVPDKKEREWACEFVPTIFDEQEVDCFLTQVVSTVPTPDGMLIAVNCRFEKGKPASEVGPFVKEQMELMVEAFNKTAKTGAMKKEL